MYNSWVKALGLRGLGFKYRVPLKGCIKVLVLLWLKFRGLGVSK